MSSLFSKSIFQIGFIRNIISKASLIFILRHTESMILKSPTAPLFPSPL